MNGSITKEWEKFDLGNAILKDQRIENFEHKGNRLYVKFKDGENIGSGYSHLVYLIKGDTAFITQWMGSYQAGTRTYYNDSMDKFDDVDMYYRDAGNEILKSKIYNNAKGNTKEISYDKEGNPEEEVNYAAEKSLQGIEKVFEDDKKRASDYGYEANPNDGKNVPGLIDQPAKVIQRRTSLKESTADLAKKRRAEEFDVKLDKNTGAEKLIPTFAEKYRGKE